MNKQQRRELEKLVAKIDPYQDDELLADMDSIGRDAVVVIIEDAKSEVDNIRSDEEEKLENLPDSLKEGSSGTAIQEGIDYLNTAISVLEDIASLDQDDDWAEEVANKVSEVIENLNSV